MKFLALVASLLLIGCSGAQESNVTESIEIPLEAPRYVTWQNPRYEGCPAAKEKHAHPHMKFVPEGLTLFDGSESVVTSWNAQNIDPVTLPHPTRTIDTSKKTIVFVIGYDKTGRAYDFFNIKQWQKDYNVFVYRWHCLYYSDSLDIGKAMDAQAVATERFTAEFRKFDSLVTRWYDKEIRFAAISLGAPIAVDVAHATFGGRSFLGSSSYSKNGKPRFERRLDLLDPAFFLDFLTPEEVIDENGFRHAPLELNEYARKIVALEGEGVAIAGYTTAYARFFTAGLYRWMNIQRHTEDWITPEVAKIVKRKPTLGDMLMYQHIGIVPAYFASIDPSIHPVTNSPVFPHGITAATPTELIRRNKVYLKQVETPGKDTLTFADDVFEAITPCPKGISFNYDKTHTPVFNSVYWSAFRACL